MTIDINFIKFALSLFFVVQKRKTDHKHGYMEDTISERKFENETKESEDLQFPVGGAESFQGRFLSTRYRPVIEACNK